MAISPLEVLHCAFRENCEITSVRALLASRPDQHLMNDSEWLKKASDRRDYFRLAQGLISLSRIDIF